MGLKAFHLFFLVMVILMDTFITFWSLRDYARHQSLTSLLLAIFTAATTVAILFYAKWFLSKLREQGKNGMQVL